MMKQQLVIFLAGEFDSQKLEIVRERLGLTKSGRLSDDWDANFGHRDLAKEPNRIWLDLYRDDDTSWNVTLTYEVDPLPADQVETLRRQILDAAAAVGVRVERQVPPPSADGELSAERLTAARERLAAWQTAHTMRPGPPTTAADLEGYNTKTRDEFIVFSTPGRSNLNYLVSDQTVYPYAPSMETIEIALENARAEASES
jgi:hypothetical protein